MADNNFIVSIDIGSSKIAILLAEKEDAKLAVFGHAIGDSAGVKKGMIVDVEAVSNAIKKVIKAAKLSCNTDFHNVSVNICDPQLSVINRTGQIAVLGGEITEQNITDAIKVARTTPITENVQIISCVTNHWTLDKDSHAHQIVLNQPIAQKATTLEASVHIVTVSNQSVDNIENCIRQSDLGLSNIVLNSMASSEAYITEDEKNKGVCLIDIGAEITSLSVFKQGGITHNAIIQMGGAQITENIAQIFNMDFLYAEALKLEYGSAQASLIRQDKLLKFKQIDDAKDYYLSHQQLIEVIEQSYLVLFALIKQNLKSHNLHRSLKSGLVLTGGAAKIAGCDALLLNYFKIRSKLGRINTDRITAKGHILDPIYACALGLLLFKEDEFDFKSTQSNNNRNILGKIKQQFKF